MASQKQQQCIMNAKLLFPKASDKFIQNSAKKMVKILDKYEGKPELMSKLKEFFEAEQKALAVYEKVKLENKLKKDNITKTLEDAKNKDVSIKEVAAALLVKSHKNIEGARLSVDTIQKAFIAEGNGILSQLIEIENVSDIIDGKFDEDIANFMVDEGLKKDTGKYSGPVKQVGGIYRLVNAWAIKTLRESGISIREIASYIMRQSHDSQKIEVAGFETWVQDIVPRLDMDKTFSDLDKDATNYIKDVAKYLKDTYDAIVADRGSGGINAFTHARELHFKSGADFIQYNTKYGLYETIYDSIKGSIKAVSRSASLTQILGTNHRKMIDWLKNQAEGKDKNTIEGWYQSVMGYDEVIGEHMFTKVLDAGKMVVNMSKLGGGFKAVLLDFAPSVIAHGQLTGGNMFESASNLVSNWFEALSPETRKAVARELSIDLELHHAVLNNSMFSNADGTSMEYGKGLISSAHKWFFTINGMGPLTRMNKISSSLSIARDLKRVIARELDETQKKILSHYRIGNDELAIMRLADGDFINKSAIRNIPMETLQKAFPGKSETELETLQKDAAFKVMALLIDRTDQMTPTAGKRERVALGYLHHPDTGWGRIFRLVAQFKMTSMKALNDMKYQANLYESRVPQAYLIGRRVIYGGLMAYMIEAVRQWAFEDEPTYRPVTVADAMEYLAKGGGAGIAGDFMFSKHDSFVRKSIESFAGPGFSTLADAFDLGKMALSDKPVSREAAKLIIHNTPYLGLPFIKSYKDGMIDAMDDFLSEMTPYRKRRR